MQQPLPLRDIKPIVEVPDHSLWLLAALVAAVLVLAGTLAWWLRTRARARRDARREEALRRLDALRWDDTKQAVYDFSLLSHFVVTDRNRDEWRSLLSALEPYKFRKEVPPLDAGLKNRMKRFIKEAHRG
jgi:hypothetical protein